VVDKLLRAFVSDAILAIVVKPYLDSIEEYFSYSMQLDIESRA
jgi:hypothetical protein